MGGSIERRPTNTTYKHNQQMPIHQEPGLLSQIFVWLIKKTLGSIIISTMRYSSATDLLAVGIAISLLLGFIFNANLLLTAKDYVFTFPGICTTVGALGGAGAAGFGGAIIGASWGWLVGMIAGAGVSTSTSESMKHSMGILSLFLLSAIMGWISGKIASTGYDYFASRDKIIHKIIGSAAITIAVSSFAIFVYKIIGLINFNHFLPSIDALFLDLNIIFKTICILVIILILLFLLFWALTILVTFFGYENLFDLTDSFIVQWHASEGNVKLLIKILEKYYEKNENARASAARALGDLTSTLAVQPLTTALQNDPSSKVRDAARDTLAKISQKNPSDNIHFLQNIKLFRVDIEKIVGMMSINERMVRINDGVVDYSSIRELIESGKKNLRELHIISLPSGEINSKDRSYISLDIKKAKRSDGVILSSSPDLEKEFYQIWDLLLEKQLKIKYLCILTNLTRIGLNFSVILVIFLFDNLPYQFVLISLIFFALAKFFVSSNYLSTISMRDF